MTASATVASLLPSVDEFDDLERCVLISLLFNLGMTAITNFRGLLDRLTTTMSQQKGSPTYISSSPVNVTEMARSLTETPGSRLCPSWESRPWLELGPTISRESVCDKVMFVGLLLRRKGWVGTWNVGFKAVEKSTPAFHRIFMHGLQVSLLSTMASIDMSSVLEFEFGLDTSDNGPPATRRNKKVGLSLGRQVIGNIDAISWHISSLEPSESLIWTDSIQMSWSKNVPVSKSMEATIVGFPVTAFTLE